MLVLFAIVLLACVGLGAALARSKAASLLLVVAMGLLVVGLGLFAVVAFGPRDLWVRVGWVPHPWLMGALGPVGIATGAAVLLGVGVGKARRPRGGKGPP